MMMGKLRAISILPHTMDPAKVRALVKVLLLDMLGLLVILLGHTFTMKLKTRVEICVSPTTIGTM
jgi:hypothetical protein